MSTLLYKNWWLLSIKAASSILIGLLILIDPHSMANTMMVTFGILVGISGLALVSGAFSHRIYNSDWTWWLLEGLIDLLICLLILLRPFDSANFMCLVAGIWLSLIGFVYLATAINIQYYVSANTSFVITAVLLTGSGLFLLIFYAIGLMVLMTIAGVCILLYGILQAYISIVLKNVSVEEIGEIKDLY